MLSMHSPIDFFSLFWTRKKEYRIHVTNSISFHNSFAAVVTEPTRDRELDNAVKPSAVLLDPAVR